MTRHVNDGRAFLTGSDKKYDLILFALPDSLTLVSGASQIRLESFLFTQQAIEEARDHLKPDGSFAMYNYYRESWLIDRLAGTAQTVFGHTPCVDTFAGAQAVVTAALDEAHQQCARGVPALRRGDRAVDRRPAVPLLQGRGVPEPVPLGDRGHPAGLGPRPAGARRVVPVDAAVRRPVLHGRGVPAARDQERRHVRAAVRHHLAGQRAGVRRRPRGGAGRRGDRETRAYAATSRGLRRHRGLAGAGVHRQAGLAAAAAVRAAAAARRRCWPSCRSTWPTSRSRSGSATRATRARRSR